MKTTPERANEYMERIQRVYDEHMDMLEKWWKKRQRTRMK